MKLHDQRQRWALVQNRRNGTSSRCYPLLLLMKLLLLSCMLLLATTLPGVAGTDDGGENDGGENDGGENDGGENDGGENDGGENDGGENDGGENDGGETDDGEEETDSDDSETYRWMGCEDPNNRDAKIKLGEKTTVCLFIGNGVTWNNGSVEYIRMTFQPVADEYTQFHVPNSYADLTTRGNAVVPSIFYAKNVSVAAASLSSLSFLRLYFDPQKERVYPHLTAIIDVDEGVVQGITWDDACVFCDGDTCDEDTYDFNGVQQNKDSAEQSTKGCWYSSLDDCDKLQMEKASENSFIKCDVTLFVVWTGTDVDGKALLSSSKRFSVFPNPSIEDKVDEESS